jgi:hypothetical protein
MYSRARKLARTTLVPLQGLTSPHYLFLRFDSP